MTQSSPDDLCNALKMLVVSVDLSAGQKAMLNESAALIGFQSRRIAEYSERLTDTKAELIEMVGQNVSLQEQVQNLHMRHRQVCSKLMTIAGEKW